MNVLISTIVAISILTGQIVKIPAGSNGGVSILDLAVIGLCLLGLVKLNFRFKKPPLHLKTAFIFIGITLLSLILSPLSLSPADYLTGSFYILRLFFYILLAEILYSGAFPEFKGLISSVLILSGAGLALGGLLQFIFFPNLNFLVNEGWDPHYFRTVSTFLDPNFAGAFFVLTLILAFHPGNITRKTPWIFYLIFTLTYLALLTTFSRSSYIMFLVSFSILSFLKRSWKLQITTIILFALLIAGFSMYTKAISKPRNIDRTQSASFRMGTWQQGMVLLRKFPVLGVGFNVYRQGIREFNLGDSQFIQSHGSSGNDSSLLFVASTTGIIGLIAYILFLLAIFRFSYSINFPLFSALSGLLLHSFFSNSLFYSPVFLWILLISVSSKK